jgi:signal transduction histidine kinase
MRRVVVAVATGGFCALAALLMSGVCSSAIAGDSNTLEPPAVLTNLFQLRRCAEQKPFVLHPFRIVAEVLDADSDNGVLALQDASGVEFVQLDLRGQKVEPGAKVCLEGNGCGVMPQSFGLAIVPGMVVDNDGLHSMMVESGTAPLRAGSNPLAVLWFNGPGSFGLKVEYEGPGLPRQPMPDSALSRACVDPATGVTNFSASLDYRCYEGAWAYLPDFAKLHPVKHGVVTNFDLSVRTQDLAVGLEFNGFIKIPQDGEYTFYVTSDDGSRLFVGQPSWDVRVLTNGPAAPAAANVSATVPEPDSPRWITLQGTVSFAGVQGTGGELALRVGNDDVQVEIFKSGQCAPNFPLGATVRVSGVWQNVLTADGSRVPGRVLASSWKAVRLVPSPENVAAAAISGQAAPNHPAGGGAAAEAAVPPIATVAEIKALPPDLLKRRLPVSVRGVVTAIHPAFRTGAFFQDSTKGIFVSLQDIKETRPLQRGEFCQIDGVASPGSFAPIIVARHITRLGAGQLPRPVHAARDQLMNGSLDNLYVEMDGFVTAAHGQQIEMLTEGGNLTLGLSDFQSEALAGFENAVVRIRGCFSPSFNYQTHELEAGSFGVCGGAVEVLQPPPRDPFDAPQKNLGELLLYDPKASPFRRLKVSGQVVYGSGGEYFLSDGTNGMRVTTRSSDAFAAGDRVDAVGFLELGGPAPELKEAVMRKTGRAPLPAPAKLAPDRLLLARYAGLPVQVDATLINQWQDGPESLLNLQSGLLAFRARINRHGKSISLPPSGSRLELTGIYSPQGSHGADGTVSGFELLLNSPADLRVLATPPWWTLKRLLLLAGTLAALLCAVLAWNKQLHWQVQERGRRLEREIRSRQRAELQHAAEAERSRIARDLHDELGTGLTEVSLLASAGLDEFQGAKKNNDRFHIIAEKARTLVSGLDVIVWAIDPKRDSLQSFADYLGSYATELLAASNVVCRLRIPIECDAVTLPGAARHNLFLAVKEALNNVIRHASATEVELQMTWADHRLEIVIADNGRGFDGSAIRRGHGLVNLQERLKTLNGQCHIESQPGKGTTVKFIVPLPRDSSQPAHLKEPLCLP